MILPKGTIDLSRQGGEKAIEELLTNIRNEKTDGYLLVLGNTVDMEGKEEDVTAQLLFHEGEPRLCEAVVNKAANKGPDAVYYLLKTMMVPENTIEFHTKIDVGPPLAFFKECIIEEKDMDLGSFRKRIEKEAEERFRLEKERKEQEEAKEKINQQVTDWIASGYMIREFPEILDGDHGELVKWFEKLSSNIEEIGTIVEWTRSIDDIEVKRLKERLLEKAKHPGELETVKKIKGDMEAKLDDVKEKRTEMNKWVALWKEEGYNTENIEKNLDLDLETAWKTLTHFMDDIQSLRERKEEIEKLREEDPKDHFGAEFREMEFLLNDPDELSNIDELLGKMRKTMEAEKREKENILEEAKKFEEKGYDISTFYDLVHERSNSFRNAFEEFVSNVHEIEQIKDEARDFDRKDLGEEIDVLLNSLTEPDRVEEYQNRMESIKKRIEELNEIRKDIRQQLDRLKDEGFETTHVDEKMDGPFPELEKAFEDYRSGVSEIKAIREKITDMDRRWLEDEFEELEQMTKDPMRSREIETKLKELEVGIREREEERELVGKDLEEWSSEGFNVEELENVMEENLPIFREVHGRIKERISEARELLKDLDSLEIGHFPEEGEKMRELLHDPKKLDEAKNDISDLKAMIAEDLKKRKDLKDRLHELERSGWDISGLEDLSDLPPGELASGMEVLEKDVLELEEALKDMDGWDTQGAKHLSKDIIDTISGLKKIEDRDGSLDRYHQLRKRYLSDMKTRDDIRKRTGEWKDSGYAVKEMEEKLEGDLDDLKAAFDDMKERISALESFQKEFDGLKIDHFRTEAEEIEFKLNDPSMIDDISSEMEELKEKIADDEAKRAEFRGRIERYIQEGYIGSKKLEGFMDEDISIVEIEFKNFDKEVQLFRKYMETTGFEMPTSNAGGNPTTIDEGPGNDVSGPDKVGYLNADKEAPPEEGPFVMTFDNYIVDPSNELARNTALEIAMNPGKVHNPLLILGDRGMGKTHLISSIAASIGEREPDMNIIRMSGSDFVLKLREHRQKETMEDFRDLFRGADILLMDDIDLLRTSEDGQDMFINVMNGMIDKGKQVVLASEREIRSMPKVADQIRSRLDSGMSVDLEGTTSELNRKLIDAFGSDRMPVNVKKYFATNLLGSVSDVKVAVELFIDGWENGSDHMDRARSIIEKISMDPGHTKLTEELEDTLGEMGVDIPTEIIVCNNCNKEIPSDSTSCPYCGAEFDDVELKECPVCRQLSPLESNNCSSCGAPF